MVNERKKKRPVKKKAPSVKKAPPVQRPPAQEVIHTPPEPLNRRKLILRLLTVAAVAVAVFLGFSIFFRVDNIVVSGMEKYTAWAVREASGIEEGESLLSFGKAKAAGRITEELDYIKSVRIGITLPGTVNIYVEELDVVYSAQDQNDRWWLIASDGRIVDEATESAAAKHTTLKGFRLQDPVEGEQAVAVEEEPGATDEAGEDIIITITNKERLETALSIVYQLELNEILGKAASVDVTDMGNIELWYGTQYQVKLGDAGLIEQKVATMKRVITDPEMEGHHSGVLDITFTNTDGVRYTPFE